MISKKEIRMFLNKKGTISKEKLRELFEGLKQGKIPKDQITGVITLFGQEQFRRARKEIEKYLNSEDIIERYSALSNLVFEWGIQEHRKTAEKFLLKDPDEDIRGLGAACLGSLLRGTYDQKALKLLLKIFKNKKEDWLVRSSAYSAILDVIGIPRQEQPGALGSDYEKYVDSNLIKSIEKRLKNKFKDDKK